MEQSDTMTGRVNVSTQGISVDLRLSNGEFDEAPRGAMTAMELTQFLTRIQPLTVPPYVQRDADYCPPAVHIEGPAGVFNFFMEDGAIHTMDTGTVVTPSEVAVLAFEPKKPVPVVVRLLRGLWLGILLVLFGGMILVMTMELVFGSGN